MEQQKTKNLPDNTLNQPSKFRTKKWAEINDESRGTYAVNKQIKFKTSMLRSNLYLLKEIHQLIILRLLVLMQIILIKKKYLKIVLDLLTVSAK